MNPNLADLLSRTDRVMSGPNGRVADLESAHPSGDSVPMGYYFAAREATRKILRLDERNRNVER